VHIPEPDHGDVVLVLLQQLLKRDNTRHREIGITKKEIDDRQHDYCNNGIKTKSSPALITAGL